MDIKINEEWKQENGKYKCPHCLKEYSKNGISTHIWRSHGDGKSHNPNIGYINNTKKRVGWNKGLTKETNDAVRRCGETYSKRVKAGEVGTAFKGKNLPEEMKKKISESMKKAHKEDRAWNIGKSRWNNEPSYPEKFFIQVIENEFEDKNYQREFPISRYSIDFAWVEKKLAIEIDGSQHQRFKEYRERDAKKDKLLHERGWRVLRINWEDMFHNPKEFIEKAKLFIH